MDALDRTQEVQQPVTAAALGSTALSIYGGGSKRFLGRTSEGESVCLADHRGVIGYEPTELVITARAGTPVAEIETVLAKESQMLAFEPPHFGPSATLGGTLASALSGPRRPYAGAARDFVLGTRIVNGQGEVLRFGSEAIKNVAGYDVSRLMVGAFGTLGIILDASLKVLPTPAYEITLAFDATEQRALEMMNQWACSTLPLSASCFYQGHVYLRLSGTATGLKVARDKIGGESLSHANELWLSIREHTHLFFCGPAALWRLCVPEMTEPISIDGD